MNKKIKSNINNYLPCVAEKSTGYNSDDDDEEDSDDYRPVVKKDTTSKRQTFLKQNNLPNWRSEQKTAEKPIVFRNYRQIGSSMSSPSYQKSYNDTTNTNEIHDWRKDCLFSSVRNCGMTTSSSSSSSSTTPTPLTSDYNKVSIQSNCAMGIGLSPPSESLMMQRRMKLLKTNELLNNPPATVSG